MPKFLKQFITFPNPHERATEKKVGWVTENNTVSIRNDCHNFLISVKKGLISNVTFISLL